LAGQPDDTPTQDRDRCAEEQPRRYLVGVTRHRCTGTACPLRARSGTGLRATTAAGVTLPRVPFCIVLFLLAAAGSPLRAQNTNDVNDAAAEADARRSTPMTIGRATGSIVLDGRIDEAAWDDAVALPVVMHEPTFLGATTERTDIRLAYDDEYLYLAGSLHDSDPSGVRTNTFVRDTFSGDDLLALVIDSYNDYETAVWFITNPAGTRNDRTVSNDAVGGGGGMPMNTDWNAHWDVATSQNGDGWFAEMRIPFSTLGFQVVNDQVVMGVIVYRLIARKNERHTFPPIDPKWGNLAFAKPSQAQRIVLRGVRQSAPIYVTPYALAGFRRTPSLDEPAGGPAAWRSASDASHEAGLDLRYSPVSNLSLDLTANTDFAQVEADDQQINLTRFPLFFPEKRQFFQERSSTFQFATGGMSDRLFHSRRIGLEDGEIVRIWGGGRAVGQIGGLDFGFLDMQTADHAGRSAENMGVLRVQQQVFNPYSSVGAMLTTRLGSNGEDNVAYGLDARVRPFGDEYVTVKWAQTFDEAVDEKSAPEAGLVQTRWERVRDEGISYSAEFRRVGADYLPRLGFQSRRDYRYWGGNMQYRWFSSPESPVRTTSVDLSTSSYIRGLDGEADSRSIQSRLQLEMKEGAELWITGRATYESVLDPFTVAGAGVLAGDYWFYGAEARLQLDRNNPFRGNLNATAGSFYDGTRFGVELAPTWNPSKYVELAAGYEINHLRFADRDESATAHLARFKVRVALNTKLSFDTFAQYSNIADLGTFNARFRYNFREGTDFWIVWNEGVYTERDVAGQPRLPASAGRSLMIKYTHTFAW
jgi:hypothetical protein